MGVELIARVYRYQNGSSDKVYVGVNSRQGAAAFYGKTRGTLQKAVYAHGQLQEKLEEKTRKGYGKASLSDLSDAQKRQIKSYFSELHACSHSEISFVGEVQQPEPPKAPDPKIEQKRAETYGDW